MQLRVEGKIPDNISLLHDAGVSQILLLHHAAGSQILMPHDAAES
jgi:hypothetical protein